MDYYEGLLIGFALGAFVVLMLFIGTRAVTS